MWFDMVYKQARGSLCPAEYSFTLPIVDVPPKELGCDFGCPDLE